MQPGGNAQSVKRVPDWGVAGEALQGDEAQGETGKWTVAEEVLHEVEVQEEAAIYEE